MRYIDIHCHIDGENYGDSDGLFARLKSVGVEKVICAGVDLQTSVYSSRLAEYYEGCYFTAGIHPTELAKSEFDDLEAIYRLARHPKCVAIGEIGLDYHYPDTNKELQQEYFVRQLGIASRLGLPVQIHSRDSAEDTLQILKENKSLLANGGLMHCFSYSPELAKEFEKLGLHFSFGGSSTWSGNKKAKRAIAALDVGRLLTETDSPYQPPASKYGTFPNTPESIPEIAENIAAIKGITLEEFTETVWENAHALFKKLNN